VNACFGEHAITQPGRRYKGYAIDIRYEIRNVKSAKEWDFTAQIYESGVWCAP